MKDVQELLGQLKPLIGAQADRLWLAYLSEDMDGKRQIETALRLLAQQRLWGDVSQPEVHLSAPSPETSAGAYPVGEVMYAGNALGPFGLREEEWIQHTAIFGRSGAGKTNTVLALLEALLKHGKPFLIFDWKRNYRDLLAVTDQPIEVVTAGRACVPFAFNPLIPPEGTDAAVWLKKLIEIIAHAYYLGEGVMFLLQEALHAVYQDFGVYRGRPQTWPTFQDVLRRLEGHPVRGRQALWMDSALRGVKSICFGHMGDVVNASRQPNLSALLEKNVILELDGLTNADKTLITEGLLLWIHHWRLTQPDRETFKHAIIIEEAHHILLKRTGGQGGEAVTDTILREIRELGEAIVLVDQHPSLISIPALGNTHTTIAMNLKHRSDTSAISAAMLLAEDEQEILGRLPIGWAVVKLQSRWLRPFLVRIPHRRVPKGQVTDLMLEQRMRAAHTEAQSHEENTGSKATAPGLSEREESFLRDVAAHPFSGTVERYARLSLSRRQGHTVREELAGKGLVGPVAIPTRAGRIVLLELTSAGRAWARERGMTVTSSERWGSLEHEYWKHRAAIALEAAGWTVKQEEPVNGFTDLIAEHEGQRVAVEIETGKSDWQANLTKNIKKGFGAIRILTTSAEAWRAITADLPSVEGVDVQVMPAEEFLEQLKPPPKCASEASLG